MTLGSLQSRMKRRMSLSPVQTGEQDEGFESSTEQHTDHQEPDRHSVVGPRSYRFYMRRTVHILFHVSLLISFPFIICHCCSVDLILIPEGYYIWNMKSDS